MEYAFKLISVFLTSMLELWAAIPMGFVLKLDPVINGLVSIAGAMTGAMVVIFGGEGIRKNFNKKQKQNISEENPDGKKSAARKIWDKYGVIGLGLLAPWITGAPLAAAIGVGLKADPKKLLFWITAGIIICTLIFVSLGAFGVTLLKK